METGKKYLEMANSPLMWIAAGIAVFVVLMQSVIFFRKSLKAAPEVGLTKKQVKMAIQSSAISSIGPSIVILVTMISLLVTMGAPVSWMRLSFIGSVNYEAMAAGFGAQAMGTDLQHLTPIAFSCGLWTMILGSLGWLIFTLLFADKMNKVNHLLSKGNERMVPIISAGAMLGAFANLAAGNFFTETNSLTIGSAPSLACVFGCGIMMVLTKVAKTKNIQWLKEWSFAIAMFSGMFVGYLAR
ncbi:MAG: DUF5058 family protein [Lachnospiraceae bacterium]|jgi:hypothetical protein|nr:DUF5058 family protein [Lachnospiraceae bacterium]